MPYRCLCLNVAVRGDTFLFRFDKSAGMFMRWKKGKSVDGYPGICKEHILGRMNTVHIRNTECFYLRMLLHTVRGPTSFEALRTVNGVILPSFERAWSSPSR